MAELALYPGLTVTIRASILANANGAGAWGVGVWDTAVWGGTPQISDNPGSGNWADISIYTQRFNTSLGRQRQTDQFAPGPGTFVLNNSDGRFSPDNASNPYRIGGLDGVRPWQAIQVMISLSGINYGVWTGLIQSWRPSYDPATFRPIVVVNAIDLLGQVGMVNLGPLESPAPAELSGARVSRILTAAGFKWYTQIAAGTQMMAPTLLGTNALSEIQAVCESENGAFFNDPSYGLVFEDANALVSASRSTTSQATFGELVGSGEIPYESIELSTDGSLIFNLAIAQRTGGIAQQALDLDSRELNGLKSAPPTTGLWNIDDIMPAQLAAWAVKRFAKAEQRVVSLKFHPSASPYLTSLTLLRVRDRVTVKHRPRSSTAYTVTREAFVDGVDHEYVAETGEWWTTIRLADAAIYDGVGVWDSGLWDTATFFT